MAMWLRVLGSNTVADQRFTPTLANSSPKFNSLVKFVNNRLVYFLPAGTFNDRVEPPIQVTSGCLWEVVIQESNYSVQGSLFREEF